MRSDVCVNQQCQRESQNVETNSITYIPQNIIYSERNLYVFRYNSETGVFTVGSGAAGTYNFSTYLSVFYDEYGVFEIEVNNEAVCTSFGDQDSNKGNDVAQATCSAVVNVNEGNYIALFAISKF